MTQFAYLKIFKKWDEMFPSGQLESTGEDKLMYIELNAAKLSTEEISVLRKLPRTNGQHPFCPVCLKRLIYDKGYRKPTEGGNHLYRSPSFKHLRRECFTSESLVHAVTKRFLYQKLEQIGYRVYEDKVPINGKQYRADVAAFRLDNDQEELRLVVDILASASTPEKMARKINRYVSKQVPTAWVLLLDTFFVNTPVGGVSREIDESIQYEIRYTYTPVAPGQEDTFLIPGAENKAFTFLMDHYDYAIGVWLPGYVMLIRREKRNEEARLRCWLRGETWNTQDDLFIITRIADKHIARALMMSPLLQFDVPDPDETVPGTPRNLEGADTHHPIVSEPIVNELVDIDFSTHALTGSEADQALDPLQWIQEIQRLRQETITAFEQEQDAIQEQSYESSKHEDEIVYSNSAIDLTRSREEPRVAKLDHWPPTTHKLEEWQRELLLMKLTGKGYGLKTGYRFYLHDITQEQGLELLNALSSNDLIKFSTYIERTRETITEAYKALNKEDRIQLGKNLFPEGLAELWFSSMQVTVDQLDAKKRKKEEDLARKALNKKQKGR